MKHTPVLLPCLAWLLFAAACTPWPDLPDGPGLPPPLPPDRTLAILAAPVPPGPAVSCGAPLRLVAALPDPLDRPDREGEWVALAHASPTPLSLRDWRLTVGRRKHVLPDVVLAPFEVLVLGGPSSPWPIGSLRLANASGTLRLFDPCGGEVDTLRWGSDGCAARPGVPVVGDGPVGARAWAGQVLPWKHEGPTRALADGADGGCGQT